MTNVQLDILLSEPPLALKAKENPPQGVTVRVLPYQQTRTFGAEGVVQVILQFAADVAVGIVSAWLYDWLKNSRSKRVIVNRKEVVVSLESITKVVEESVEVREEE